MGTLSDGTITWKHSSNDVVHVTEHLQSGVNVATHTILCHAKAANGVRKEHTYQFDMDGSPGIGEATKVAKEYVEQYRTDDWEEVVDAYATSNGNKTKIEFQTADGHEHQINVDGDGDITYIDFHD